MYKGLKTELEEAVSQIRIGDGVVIEHPTDYFADRTIGYVQSINPTNLTLTKTRESRLFLETFFNHFLGNVARPYDSFENIMVVDPVKTD